jgi:hypothetical protein
MDNEKLIKPIRSHTELYDLSNSKYSDSTWKEKIWKGIGEKLNQTGKTIYFNYVTLYFT